MVLLQAEACNSSFLPKGRTIPLAQKQGRTIVFIDESGLSQRPHRCRTWAPRGQTPVLEFNFNWKKLSAAAGLTFRNFYFRLYPDAVRGPEVIDFLKALVRHIRRPLLVVWDRRGWRTRRVPGSVLARQG